MQHLRIIIERATDNYAAYIDGVDGITVTGKTIDEIRSQMKEAIELFLETSRELGTEIPSALAGEYDMTFEMDARTLLNYYDGVFGKPALEKITGINQKQLWHYASGKARPRAAQRAKINAGLHSLGQELMMVHV